ncbi:MORN repeat protein, putative [Plasmodium chabaudi chabaudi]|uniref:MORN repeat protein, putative n=1 Tax=Plasmodium chabaudi chabaudi TaxID=31271 RepID=A0A4V0K9X2_PLACU|nr:MORN repeat protein, putative [Plasmodium chabaudi chabaudi]VTZ69566.1 MORN repeat protein, putative [Plasmodium chabaudi chabaudi]|eukprot:XP_016654187.1 conserved Plasmodium protein, unknown function [Plasmodium chabaudi chabaudi]
MAKNKNKKSKLKLFKDDGIPSTSLKNYTGIGTVIFYPCKNYKTQEKYYGNFLLGKKHGYGEYEYLNGDLYQGSFEHNKKNGIGTYFFNNYTNKKKGNKKIRETSQSSNNEESENESNESMSEGSKSKSSENLDNKEEEESEESESEGSESKGSKSEDEKSKSEESKSEESKSEESENGESENEGSENGESENEGSENEGSKSKKDSEKERNKKKKKLSEKLLSLMQDSNKLKTKKEITCNTKEGKSYYYGNYSNGMKHDEGLMVYKNGDVYVGTWRFGKKNGYGKYIYKKCKSVLEGHWENGYLSHGKWILPNGTYFIGNFKNNEPIGDGVWYFKDGAQLNVHYYKDEKKYKKKNEQTNKKTSDLDVCLNCKPLYITYTRSSF